MRLPRDLDGSALIRKLQKLGYKQVRQTESHVRLTCVVESREHHLTIPLPPHFVSERSTGFSLKSLIFLT
jgi:predicted RNA binding protein YcfA (HicA-like mRNA interferase family)